MFLIVSDMFATSRLTSKVSSSELLRVICGPRRERERRAVSTRSRRARVRETPFHDASREKKAGQG